MTEQIQYDSEFAFELRVCYWAEREWPPGGTLADDTVALVARQLGTKRRRWDTIVVETTREALVRRANLGTERLDDDLRFVLRSAPEEWTYYRDALPEPDYPWRYVRETIHAADDRGILDVRKSGNRIEIRRRYRYPEWVERIVAIENKPDLDASAATALQPQLERDVALGLADEAWVATRATDAAVSPVLFEDLPVKAGVLEVDPTALSASIAWHAQALEPATPGTRITDRGGGDSAFDQSAATFEYVSPDRKATLRYRIAERAYERGWRSFVDTMRPDCRWFGPRERDGQVLPWCGSHCRVQTANECSGSCPAFEPEPPSWRQHGWPIDGGPGKTVTRLLAARRARLRGIKKS
ncbi:DUF5787 family protein [Natranaeroarchaeum sulfidigenes]|uniref:Uncharacterized protein n=1 Tax=Natranaeroarchaeum sulfidigenes TaxID=2784880 RepID=A0A897MX38_9EURY|nr:DUF5787 family protein [Natranaeroarchaeum sulfidigenes]QSG03653.1 Uncharacterized protein AArcS_2457 [Natranaeroarchaeum sulfidigenes]